jgi:hypothetical protein
MSIKKTTKKKRIVLGRGYPWFQTVEKDDLSIPRVPGPHRVGLWTEKHGQRITLNYGNSGAWKKYRLVLEEI